MATSETKLLAFEMSIRQKLEYASEVWDPHTKKLLLKLKRIEKLAPQFIYSKYKRLDSPTELFLKAGISILEKRRWIKRLDMF